MRHEEIAPPELTRDGLASQQVEEEQGIEEQYAAHRAEQDRAAELTMQQAVQQVQADDRASEFSRDLMSFATSLARTQAAEMFPNARAFNERMNGMAAGTGS
jgi:hypothetical protein